MKDEVTFALTATCPLCQSDGAPRLFVARDRVHNVPGTFALYRCSDCHAVFIRPWLNDSQLAGYYPAAYGRYRHSRSLNKKNYRGWRRVVMEGYYGYPAADGSEPSPIEKTLGFFLSFVGARGVIPYRGAGKILDVGCGGGSYLYLLKQWGWDAYGVEPSASGAKQAQSLGLAVRHGSLDEARFPSGFFDVVRLSDVLEHLPNPIRLFREINRILKPDGLVYVTVPNTRSLVFWLFRENWYALDPPRHVISYSPRALATLCAAAGFEIAGINFASGPFNFVRSMNYFLAEKGAHWPAAIRRIDWVGSKAIRRALKPVFFVIDGLGYGDALHATLRKQKSIIIDRSEIFQKAQRAGHSADATARYEAEKGTGDYWEIGDRKNHPVP